MTTNNFFSRILLTLFLLTMTISKKCSKHCLKCNENTECEVCYKSWLRETGVCEWSKEIEENLKKINCVSTGRVGTITACSQCSQGYHMDTIKRQCVKLKDARCVLGFRNPIMNKEICAICRGSAPEPNSARCSRELDSVCVYGGVAPEDGYNCFYCREERHVAVKGRCVEAGVGQLGCNLIRDEGCVSCKFFHGYFMTQKGVCEKFGTADGTADNPAFEEDL